MEKRHALSIVTLICYLIMAGGGAVIALGGKSTLENMIGSGGGTATAFIGIFIAVFMVVGLIYAAIGVLPIIFKIIHLFVDSPVPAGLCIIFDLAYVVLNGYFLISSLPEYTEGAFIIFAVLTVISLIALITNIASMRD